MQKPPMYLVNHTSQQPNSGTSPYINGNYSSNFNNNRLSSTQMTIIPTNSTSSYINPNSYNSSININPSTNYNQQQRVVNQPAPKFQLMYHVQPQLQQFQQKVLIQNLNSNMNSNVQYLSSSAQPTMPSVQPSYQSHYQIFNPVSSRPPNYSSYSTSMNLKPTSGMLQPNPNSVSFIFHRFMNLNIGETAVKDCFNNKKRLVLQ